MMIECAKMNCSECQHNGTCTNQKNVELFRKLFTRYGYYSPETCEKHINLYEPHPENLNTHELIEKAFERTAQDIRLLEYAIEQLKAYQIALSEQYNYIATSPTREKISLIRRRSYSDKKVFIISSFTV